MIDWWKILGDQNELRGQFVLSQATGLSPETYVRTFQSYEEARDFAVPDHDDEWVHVPDAGFWYHGGGNEAGQSFYIREVT